MMSGPPTAVLFDCDGTLFDTEDLKAKSWGKAMVRLLQCAHISTPHGMEGQVTGMYQAGGSTKGVASHVLQKSQERFPNIADWPSLEDLIEERKKAKKELFDRAFPPQSSTSRIAKNLLIAPVWEFAVAAKRTGHTVGLVTTTEREWVERYLAASDVRGPGNAPMTQPEQFFDVVVCGKKKGE